MTYHELLQKEILSKPVRQLGRLTAAELLALSRRPLPVFKNGERV